MAFAQGKTLGSPCLLGVIADTTPAQNPDTTRVPLSTILPGPWFNYRIHTIWFNFITDAAVGARDWAIEARGPQFLNPGSTSHYYLVSAGGAGQPAGKNFIYTFGINEPDSNAEAAGEVVSGVIPDMWLPAAATIEISSTGPAGAAADKFTNITLGIEVS